MLEKWQGFPSHGWLHNARANAIVVSEGIVYAAGAELKDGNYFVAKYWFNGEDCRYRQFKLFNGQLYGCAGP